ncbi:MAG: type II secretion system protein [Acidimicrobiales bacterium]
MASSLIERLNDRREAAEDAGEDAGFTLIELMVVLLIMAILLAIAIPTFLGVTGSANDRAAQSNLNTAYTSAKNYYESNGQSYSATYALGTGTGTVANKVAADEPGLSVVTGTTAGTSQIALVATTGGNGLAMFSQAKKTNDCWFIVDNTTTLSTTPTQFPWTNAHVGTSPGVYYGVVSHPSGGCGTGTTAGAGGAVAVQTGGFPAAP